MILQYAVGGAMIPFITVLLRDRGLNVSEISQILAANSAALIFAPFLWGMIADRFIPLNRLFAVMNTLAAVALGLFAEFHDFWGSLLTFTVFFGCFQPAPTLVNALCFRHLENPVEEFAPLRAWGSLGWILPSLPIFLYLACFPVNNFEFIIYLAIGLCLLMALASFWLPHTPPGSAQRTEGTRRRLTYFQALRLLTHNPGYLVVLASYFLVSASFCIQSYYSPPRLTDLGLSRAWIGPAQSAGVIVEILCFYYRKAILRRTGYAGSVLAGSFMLFLRQLLFASVDSLPWLCVSYVLVGMTVVFYYIGVSILIDALAVEEVKATAQSLLLLCSSGLGPAFANWAVHRIVHGISGELKTVFWFSTLLAGAAMMVLWLGRRMIMPKEKNGGQSFV
jgi:predicted MFS family arabinose efflux permease